MADKLITDLQELDAITGDTYVPVRNAASGTRKYNLKALKDTVDAAAQAADDAATDARAAAASVDASKEAAQQAAATANDASARAEAAIEAIGDISELTVPLMSETTRGGATLGQGLTVDGGALSIGDIVTDETDGPIYSVDAEGWAEQDTTTGKNLLEAKQQYEGTLANTYYAEFFPTAGTYKIGRFALSAGTAYTLAFDVESSVDNFNVSVGCGNGTYAADITSKANLSNGRVSLTFTPTEAQLSKGNLIAFRAPRFSTAMNATFKVSNIQLEAGSTATDYEPYTGGKPSPSPDYPQEVRVCRGRNLLQNTATDGTSGNVTFTVGSDGSVTCSGTSGGSVVTLLLGQVSLKPGTQYTLSGGISQSIRMDLRSNASTVIGSDTGSGYTYTPNAEESVYVYIRIAASTSTNVTIYPQLELGSTPTPYVPYGHVGLEVRDSSDELVSVTPIPLPSKGFAAALPDGTADALAIDSAGRCEWESVSGEVVFDGSSDEGWSGTSNRVSISFACKKQASGTESFNALCDRFNAQSPDGTYLGRIGFSSNTGGNSLFFSDGTKAMVLADWKTWLASNPVTVLYPLATPTTEHAYIDLPNIPEGATITIPELREVGVKCFIPGVSELIDHANNWGARCKQNESRIAALEAAIANLATS